MTKTFDPTSHTDYGIFCSILLLKKNTLSTERGNFRCMPHGRAPILVLDASRDVSSHS